MELASIDKYKVVPLEKLVKAGWNYKEEDEALTKKLIANVKRNGQIENLIVRELDTGYYEIVNGNHRYDALTELGAEGAICFDLGCITAHEAKRIAIETNETKFRTDKVKMSELVSEMLESFSVEDLETSMPFSSDQLNEMKELGDFSWDDYDNGQQSVVQEDGERLRLSFVVSGDHLEIWNNWMKHCKEETSENVKENEAFCFLLETRRANG